MRLRCCWLLVLCLSVSVSAQARLLKACGHPFYPPVSWLEQQRLVGLAPALVEMLFTELGYQVEFVADYNWKRCLREVELGNADIVVAAYHIASREHYLAFSSTPLVDDPAVLFVHRKRAQQPFDLQQLVGQRVGLLLGDSWGEQLDSFLEQYTRIEYVSRNRQNFAKLAMGRIDYMPVGKLSGQLQSEKLGFAEQLVALDHTISHESYFLAVGRHSGLERHLGWINRQLSLLQRNGSISRLTEQYSRHYLESSP